MNRIIFAASLTSGSVTVFLLERKLGGLFSGEKSVKHVEIVLSIGFPALPKVSPSQTSRRE